MILKVVQDYDGRLPSWNVVKEVTGCNNCGCQKDEIIKSFDTYQEADAYVESLILSGQARG